MQRQGWQKHAFWWQKQISSCNTRMLPQVQQDILGIEDVLNHDQEELGSVSDQTTCGMALSCWQKFRNFITVLEAQRKVYCQYARSKKNILAPIIFAWSNQQQTSWLLIFSNHYATCNYASLCNITLPRGMKGLLHNLSIPFKITFHTRPLCTSPGGKGRGSARGEVRPPPLESFVTGEKKWLMTT